MTKQNITLQAETRSEQEGKLENLNPQEFIPAIVYGAVKENKKLKIKAQDFFKAYEQAGESNLIDLQVSGEKEPMKVLIKEVQKDVVKDFAIHVDFYVVDMTKEIITEIPLNFIGESKAVRELGAELIKNIDAVEVRCLPGDLADHIDVDISPLKNLEDSIKLEDLKLPAGITLTSETNDQVAMVREPQIQEELATTEAVEETASAEGEATEGESAKPEGEGETKKEGAKEEKKE